VPSGSYLPLVCGTWLSSLTVLVSVLGGATLMSIGILGEYVGKIYEQAKNRPLYLVSARLM